MALNPQISVAAKNAANDAILALLNVGGAGTLKIYDGTQPAGPGTAVSTQVLLATLTLSATAFAASSGGVATANTITGANAVASSTATWARLASGGATAVIDLSVGTATSDIILAGTAAITSGQPVSISSLTVTHP